MTILESVKAHAEKPENYEQGWDNIVECYTDSELLELIGDAPDAETAIAEVGKTVGVWHDRDEERRADAINSAW